MLKVIGAGFGRTGTHSLGLALEKLGFGPCYNVFEVSKNPDHKKIWNNAIDGKPVDWNRLFEAYHSTVEWPAVAFLSELIQYFPGAKIILTHRDPDSWFESANATIFNTLELSDHNPDPVKKEQSGMKRRLILEQTFAGNYRDKEYMLEVYNQHNQFVREITPPGQLLEFHVSAGWQPLCDFLDKPIPDEPFPRVNGRAEFLKSTPDWAKEILRNKRAER